MHKQLPDHTTHSTNDQESRPTRVSSNDAGAPRSMIREMEGPERIVTAVGVGFLLVSAAMLWSGSPLHKDVKTNAGHVAARLLGLAASNVGTHGSTATTSTDDCGISLLHTPARLPLASTTTPSNVLLVGEGRAGTSLVLDMISSSFNSTVFSVYEPYHRYFDKKRKETRLLPMGLGTIFNCTFARSLQGASTVIQGWAKLRKQSGDQCFFRERQLATATRNGVEKALRETLFQSCHTAAVRVAKIIRFREHMLEPPDAEVPGIRVVHLVRHPVSLIASRVRMGFGKTAANRSDHMRIECARMTARSVYLAQHVPKEHLLELRYEDLLGCRLTASWRRVLAFLGAPATSTTMKRVLEVATRAHRAKNTLQLGTFVQKDTLARELPTDVSCKEFLIRFKYVEE